MVESKGLREVRKEKGPVGRTGRGEKETSEAANWPARKEEAYTDRAWGDQSRATASASAGPVLDVEELAPILEAALAGCTGIPSRACWCR